METLRKTASVLIFPVLAWAATACEKTLPTEPGVSAPTTGSNWSGSSGTTRWVNDDGTVVVPPGPGSSCNNPGYTKIQDAVNASTSGDRINVCPGTYPEQVTVGTGKDNITLKSVALWKAIITVPTLFTPDEDGTFRIVRVSVAQNVTVVGFTISGPGPGACGSLHYGVRVDNGASANILGNHIIHIRDEPFSGCQNGVAVIVGRGVAASAQVLGNVVEDYQKNGPTVVNAGSNAVISFNRIIGHGSTSLIAQNGIQVSDNATGTVRHNFVSQNISTNPFFAATGVLFFGAGQVFSEHNTVTANDFGIYSFQTAGGTAVTESRVRGSTFDGIVLDASNSHQVTHNASDHNSNTGVALIDDAESNSLSRNQIQNNTSGGFLLANASNNTVSTNHVKSNGNDPADDITDGIRIELPSSGNTITGNHLKNNITHDCHDNTGPTAQTVQNSWSNNGEGTSFPAGLCGFDDDDGEDVNTFGWDANYPWYLSFSDAADLDFVTGYSQFDLSSLLQLLPSLQVSATRPKPSPGR